MHDCLRAQLPADLRDQLEPGELITSALQKKHGHLHSLEVLGPFGARLSRWMKRKTEKDEPLDLINKPGGRGAGGHSAAHGLASSEERQLGSEICRSRDRRCYSCLEQLWRVRPATTGFEVRKLVAQCSYASGRESRGDRFEKRVPHPCPGAVGKHVKHPGPRGPKQQRGDLTPLAAQVEAKISQ